MTTIPGRKVLRFYERKALVEAVSIGPPIVAAGYGAVVAGQTYATAPLAPWLWVGIVWLAVASVMKVWHAHAQDANTRARDEHEGLAAATHVLYAALAGHSKVGSADGSLRVTIHRVVPPLDKAATLEQLVPYVGGPGGEPFRPFPIQSGVTGKVARERTPYFHVRQNDDYEGYVSELVREWHYTEAEAKRLKSDRQSSMAVPIFTPLNQVNAVVYLDSNRKDIFNEDSARLVVSCCSGIAAFISERYHK